MLGGVVSGGVALSTGRFTIAFFSGKSVIAVITRTANVRPSTAPKQLKAVVKPVSQSLTNVFWDLW